MNAYPITKKIIVPLANNLESSLTKAKLAEIRKSMNQEELSSEAIRLLAENIPEDCLNTNGKMNHLERSVLTAIQLFSMHQQGNDFSVDTANDESKTSLKHLEIESDKRGYVIHSWINGHGETKRLGNFSEVSTYLQNWDNEEVTTSERKFRNFGESLGSLRVKLKDPSSLDRRFNSLVTSDTYERFTVLLRQLIMIFKSKTKKFKNSSYYKIDYGQLAEDLYSFLNSKKGKEKIKLGWATSYYLSRNEEINND